MYNDDTIAAAATPEGVAALAVVRVSGIETHTICKRVVKEKKRYTDKGFREISLYTIMDTEKEEPVEKATIIKYRSPESYTGEDMAEIIIHGGAINRKAVLQTLVVNGARTANPGEFTQRAYLNSKMDLPKAESVNNLIHCKNGEVYRNYIKNHEGYYKGIIQEWYKSAERISAYIESEIEFPEEVDTSENKLEYQREIKKLLDETEENLRRARGIERIDEGLRIVIAGPANAGKSTVFNSISGEQRSIVNRVPGTTRDYIETGVDLYGKRVSIIDTAGIRDAKGEIERQGIEIAHERIGKGNIVVWVSSSDEKMDEREDKTIKWIKDRIPVIGIINKRDIQRNEKKNEYFKLMGIECIETQMRNGEDRERVVNFIRDNLPEDFEVKDTIITTKRQERVIKEIHGLLLEAYKEEMAEKKAEYIKECIKGLREFTGERGSGDVFDYIFKEFCIGK